MLDSVRMTASGAVEVIAYQDDDDPPYDLPGVVQVRGPRPMNDDRVQMSGLWTKAWERATGDIAMLAGDDIIFETSGWDARINAAFDSVPDRIAMVYTANGQDDRPVLPFVSREWIDAVGFTPPDFQGWFSDEWIWSMAAEIGRVIYLPDVMIRHNQFGVDQTYIDAQRAREYAGGLRGMRVQFYDVPMVRRRDELVKKLRGRMKNTMMLMPAPAPQWARDSLILAEQAREHDRLMREETLVVVHCYAGDRDVVKNAMPLFKHHGAQLLILSPEDAPVKIRGEECRSVGRAAYYGQVSLDRQRAHLQTLLEYPHRYFLLNDADSVCLSPTIPRYLYEQAAQGIVFSNEVNDWREHPSPYPKIAMQPPYFLTRESIERMLAVADRITAHPITPYIDWYMVALVCEAGIEHHNFPNGASFPAWRRDDLPETQQLGHHFVHRNDPNGYIRGDLGMKARVREGAVLIHSVKHREVLDELVAAHADYVRRGSPPVVTLRDNAVSLSIEDLAEQVRERGDGGMAVGDSVRI